MKLPISEIEATGKTQVRVRLDTQTIDEYAEGMKDNQIFPPLVVFAEEGSERYMLADGFHRLAAAKKAGIQVVDCDVRRGGMEAALLFALQANAENGLRRSNADKSHAVTMALNTPGLEGNSLREIAQLCRVSHELVRNVKQQQLDGEVSDSDSKPKKEKPAEAVRPSREAPDQSALDLRDLRAVMSTVRAFPYDGTEAAMRMDVPKGDFHEIVYCSDWFNELREEMKA